MSRAFNSIHNYIPEPNTGCWLYLGHLDKYGYGNPGGKFVHRLSYEHYKQIKLKPEELLLHSCDQRSCINPDHLRIGTHKDNAEDRIRRNRHVSSIRKISLEDRVCIRNSSETCVTLAKKYNVHKSTISRIKTSFP